MDGVFELEVFFAFEVLEERFTGLHLMIIELRGGFGEEHLTIKNEV